MLMYVQQNFFDKFVFNLNWIKLTLIILQSGSELNGVKNPRESDKNDRNSLSF